MNRPTVSVIMPSYNHARFVTSAIGSVLAQTFADFELLISDDGSSDDSVEVIAAISDPRIRFFPNKMNRGACVVTNELVRMAVGEFVAVINSDDEWTPTKLERQIQFLLAHPEVGACFSRVAWIDRDGAPLSNDELTFGTAFEQPNRSSAEWLRHFFFQGNCLCHPSVLIRRDCYSEVGLYDNRLRQLPDFDMWIRLVKRYSIHVMDEPFVRFRVLPGENASSPTLANRRRGTNEHFFILRTFFDGMDPVLLRAGFGDLMVHPELQGEIGAEIEKAFLFFVPGLWNPGMYQLIGLDTLHTLLEREPHRGLLAASYNFDDRDFQARSAEVETLFDKPVDSKVLRYAEGRALAAELFRRLQRRVLRARH